MGAKGMREEREKGRGRKWKTERECELAISQRRGRVETGVARRMAKKRKGREAEPFARLIIHDLGNARCAYGLVGLAYLA